MRQFSTIYKVDFVQPALPTFASISQIAQNSFNSSTMVGENFEIQSSQTAQNAFHSSTMVGENFEIYSSQMAKNADFEV